MVKGSCACGQSTYDFTGEYSEFVACHCTACRKISGADRSLNLLVPTTAVTVAPGSPERRLTRKADSGGDLVHHQCSKCGSTMFSAPMNLPDMLFLKVGLIDDDSFMDSLGTPVLHSYCKNLWKWEQTFDGAERLQEFLA